MRKEFLRDVIAGSAGVLVVLAVIGLPKDPAPTQHMQEQWQTRLLPYYSPSLHSRVGGPPTGRRISAPPTP
jgi:hypothetical protein